MKKRIKFETPFVAKVQVRVFPFVWVTVCTIEDIDSDYVKNRAAEILTYLQDET